MTTAPTIISPPSSDRFYEPVPTPREPGELVRARAVDVRTGPPSRAWQVVHGSTDTIGRPNAVSCTVLSPRDPWSGPGPRPVLSYGVGVHGLGRDAAPSYLLRTEQEYELPLVERALARGWAVAVSDGEGLGMRGPHTYGAGRAGGHALLDALRAAVMLVPELTAESPALLWGYSEGGRNAAWAAELQASYAPELPLVAVAAGGVPGDLYETAKALDGGPFTGLNLAVTIGLASAHDDPDLWSIFTEEGRRTAAHAATLDVTGLIVEHPQPLSAHTHRHEPWDEPAWRAVLERERNGRRAPVVPTYLYHVTDDEIVPVRLARALALDYRDRGADVTWAEVSAPDHLSGAQVAADAALGWLDDRLAAAGLDAPRTRPSGKGGARR